MLFFPNSKQYNLKSPVNNCSRLRWVEGFMCGVKVLSTTNVDDYGMLTTHQLNAPFPVTRHQYRITHNKDILQLSSEDLNQSMSSLKISSHNISSVTDIQHVQAVCYQDMFYWGISTFDGGTYWVP